MEKVAGILITLLEWLFFLGLFGSALVIILTTLEDVKVLMEKDDTANPSEGPQHT